MNKTILCVDNENQTLRDTALFLADHNCNVYTLQGMDAHELTAILVKIQNECGGLDGLLLSANEQLPTDGVIGTDHDDAQLLQLLDEQLNGIRSVIEACLPLLRESDWKRIGMITTADSSVSLTRSNCNYAQHMVWAGLNMIGKVYFNLLRPEGFTFRWYCNDNTSGGMSAGEYLLTGLCFDANEPYIHSDENRLVLRDSMLREIPW